MLNLPEYNDDNQSSKSSGKRLNVGIDSLNYNSLKDPALDYWFSKPYVQKHLMLNGWFEENAECSICHLRNKGKITMCSNCKIFKHIKCLPPKPLLDVKVKVMILHHLSPNYDLSLLKAKLMELNEFDLIDDFSIKKSRPALSLLRTYDCILILGFSKDSDLSWMQPDSLGDLLASYVLGDKLSMEKRGVVLTSLSSSFVIGGNWRKKKLSPILTGAKLHGDDLSLGSIENETHPILTNVKEIRGGKNSFHCSGSSNDHGASLIARWSDGYPFLAVLDDHNLAERGRVVSTNFLPLMSADPSYFWDESTDGIRLLSNSLRFVANPTYEKNGGIVHCDECYNKEQNEKNIYLIEEDRTLHSRHPIVVTDEFNTEIQELKEKYRQKFRSDLDVSYNRKFSVSSLNQKSSVATPEPNRVKLSLKIQTVQESKYGPLSPLTPSEYPGACLDDDFADDGYIPNTISNNDRDFAVITTPTHDLALKERKFSIPISPVKVYQTKSSIKNITFIKSRKKSQPSSKPTSPANKVSKSISNENRAHVDTEQHDFKSDVDNAVKTKNNSISTQIPFSSINSSIIKPDYVKPISKLSGQERIDYYDRLSKKSSNLIQKPASPDRIKTPSEQIAKAKSSNKLPVWERLSANHKSGPEQEDLAILDNNHKKDLELHTDASSSHIQDKTILTAISSTKMTPIHNEAPKITSDISKTNNRNVPSTESNTTKPKSADEATKTIKQISKKPNSDLYSKATTSTLSKPVKPKTASYLSNGNKETRSTSNIVKSKAVSNTLNPIKPATNGKISKVELLKGNIGSNSANGNLGSANLSSSKSKVALNKTITNSKIGSTSSTPKPKIVPNSSKGNLISRKAISSSSNGRLLKSNATFTSSKTNIAPAFSKGNLINRNAASASPKGRIINGKTALSTSKGNLINRNAASASPKGRIINGKTALSTSKGNLINRNAASASPKGRIINGKTALSTSKGNLINHGTSSSSSKLAKSTEKTNLPKSIKNNSSKDHLLENTQKSPIAIAKKAGSPLKNEISSTREKHPVEIKEVILSQTNTPLDARNEPINLIEKQLDDLDSIEKKKIKSSNNLEALNTMESDLKNAMDDILSPFDLSKNVAQVKASEIQMEEKNDIHEIHKVASDIAPIFESIAKRISTSSISNISKKKSNNQINDEMQSSNQLVSNLKSPYSSQSLKSVHFDEKIVVHSLENVKSTSISKLSEKSKNYSGSLSEMQIINERDSNNSRPQSRSGRL